MTEASRRGFVAGAAGLVPAAAAARQHDHGAAQGPKVLTAPQSRLLAAAVDRLIPPDEGFTGAVGAGVVDYIDGQLAGPWGAGSALYRQGPFAPGTPQQGYQLPLTPRELMEAGLADFARWAEATYGRVFQDLDSRLQDEALTRLERGDAEFQSCPSALFFETLLALTIEGFFSDPIHGGNRGMVGWRLVGFPGPYAGYVDLLERHNLALTRAPRGIAEALQGQHGPGHHR